MRSSTSLRVTGPNRFGVRPTGHPLSLLSTLFLEQGHTETTGFSVIFLTASGTLYTTEDIKGGIQKLEREKKTDLVRRTSIDISNEVVDEDQK